MPEDGVSGQFDYSPSRIERLIAQGRDAAEQALAHEAHVEESASPSPTTSAAGGGTTGEAWGPLGDAGATTPFAAGAHQVAARVCSSRGACGTVDVTVTAAPAAVAAAAAPPATTAASAKAGRGKRVIDFVLKATKRLLLP